LRISGLTGNQLYILDSPTFEQQGISLPQLNDWAIYVSSFSHEEKSNMPQVRHKGLSCFSPFRSAYISHYAGELLVNRCHHSPKGIRWFTNMVGRPLRWPSYLFEIFKFLRIEDVQRTICEIWISPLPSRMHFFLHLWVGKFKWSVIFYTK
jgi:hypothetical protein